MTIYFISRHRGAIEWAQEQKITIDKWLRHLDAVELQAGDIVIGTLPINIVAKLNQKNIRYFHLELELSANERGRELSKEDMYRLNATVSEYEARVKS